MELLQKEREKKAEMEEEIDFWMVQSDNNMIL